MSSKSSCDVLILAGGLGTRLRSVVSDRPKAMADVSGRPFISLLFDLYHFAFLMLKIFYKFFKYFKLIKV